MSSVGYTSRITRLKGDENPVLFLDIARLHRDRLAAGALAQMPEEFLAAFYRHLAFQQESVVFVAQGEQGVSGFVAGTTIGSSLFKSLISARPIKTIKYSLILLLNPRLMLRISSLVLHLVRSASRVNISDCELLSMAVASSRTGIGIGRELLESLCHWFSEMGMTSFDIIAADTQVAALRFYAHHGAIAIGRIELGGLQSVHFRYPLPNELSRSSPN
jgi:GNAT superfamily N-acetyltransferase